MPTVMLPSGGMTVGINCLFAMGISAKTFLQSDFYLRHESAIRITLFLMANYKKGCCSHCSTQFCPSYIPQCQLYPKFAKDTEADACIGLPSEFQFFAYNFPYI